MINQLTKYKHILKQNILIIIYLIVVLILVYGSYKTSDTKHIGKILMHGLSALCFYLLFYFLTKGKIKNKLELILNKLNLPHKFAQILAILSSIQIITHFIALGGSPALEALSIFTTEDVSALRASITENASTLTNYLSSINLRGILPFLIIYFLIKKDKKFYYLILILGVFYSFSLMQKSYIVTVLLPTLIYCCMKLKWGYIFKHTIIIGATIISLVYIASPTPSKQIKQNETSLTFRSDVPLLNVLYGIQKRMFEVPGEIVSKWFDNIPKNKPFLKGRGYNFLTVFTGEKHVNYSTELYPIIRPNYAEQGYTGTVNTASFMYDYANFGKKGLILAGFIIALFIIIIELIYTQNMAIKLSLNLFHITLLSSAAITTLAFSGGWMFLIILYLLFLRNNTKSE